MRETMPGRPRSFDRDAAVSVALQAFWRDGYEATSIADLTSAIGINPPSLYAAFGDKQGLFGAAAECYLDSFEQGLAAALSRPTAHAALASLLRMTARAHTEPGTPPGCLVLSEPRLHAERAHLREAIAARIAQGRQDGDMRASIDAETVAGFVVTVMAGMSAGARDGAGREQLLAAAEQAIVALPGD